MDKEDKAFYEIRILQDIIARHDNISLKIKGWCIALNIAIISALYGAKISFSPGKLCIALILITVLFTCIETIYAVDKQRAMDRSSAIGKEIRSGELDNYPKFNELLACCITFKDLSRALINIRILVPYFIIIIIDILAIFTIGPAQ